MVSLNIYKNSANKFGRKTGFKIENEIEDQDQSIPKLTKILTQVFCTFGPNLVILARIDDELSCRQAQNGVTFDFEVRFDFEGQGQSLPKTIGILTKVFYTYGPNLMILPWTGDELSRGQASDYRTDGRTHRQTQATTIPDGQNWPRVKKLLMLLCQFHCSSVVIQHMITNFSWEKTRSEFLLHFIISRFSLFYKQKLFVDFKVERLLDISAQQVST